MITDPNVNKSLLSSICLCHDLAEATVGDITPYDGISKSEKRKLEEDALRQMVIDIDHEIGIIIMIIINLLPFCINISIIIIIIINILSL